MPSRLSVDDAVVHDAIMAVLRATDHAIEIPHNVMRDTLETAFAAYNAKFASPSPSSIPAPAGLPTPLTREELDALEREINAGYDTTREEERRLLATARAVVEAQQDRERLDWLEGQNTIVRGDSPILPPSCGYSVREYIYRRIVESTTPCAAHTTGGEDV